MRGRATLLPSYVLSHYALLLMVNLMPYTLSWYSTPVADKVAKTNDHLKGPEAEV